ncbi:MAG: enoyl-CoA hydratase/isomerase family protein [Saprospiraceae bacterium]|nr:enoyl-CoA hydratase/isomerase family protein [Saprospiraceae bacterium]
MKKTILYSKSKEIATIQLCNPENHNSINTEMALQIQQYLDLADEDPDVRVVILTGSGKSFCAGQDLGEMICDEAPSIRKVLTQNHNPIVSKIKSMGKPVIAAVNGVAAGAGAVFALACDLIVASESAFFIQAFSKIGLTPGSGSTYFLPRLIGMQKSMGHLLLGNKISATDAEKMGMIYAVVKDDLFETEVLSIAMQLCQLPSLSLQYTKMALTQSMGNDLENQTQLEDELKCLAGESDDYLEGVSAFLEKRKPIFNQKNNKELQLVAKDIAENFKTKLGLKIYQN